MVLLKQLEQHMEEYYDSVACSKQISHPQGLNSTGTMHYKNLFSKPLSKAEKKKLAAKKHSEAERGRRFRMNNHYDTLRTILPNLVKMDKASVLGTTVKLVTELKNTVKELKAIYGGGTKFFLPGEEDGLSLAYCEGDGGLVKVTFSCEDRLGLISELIRALRSVKGRVVKAEMVTVGGRTKWVLWVKGLNGNEGIRMIKTALRVVVHPILPSNNKRQPYFIKDK